MQAGARGSRHHVGATGADLEVAALDAAQGAVAVDDEDQLGLLQTGLAARARGITALANLVAAIYPGLDPGLRSAAALTVMAYLQKLEQSGPG
jgi:Beta-lactamase associated winged helix domain